MDKITAKFHALRQSDKVAVVRRLAARGSAIWPAATARSPRMNLYYLVVWLSHLLARICFRFRILHRERMIQSGPVILAMNHQSFFDARRWPATLAIAQFFLWPARLCSIIGFGAGYSQSVM